MLALYSVRKPLLALIGLPGIYIPSRLVWLAVLSAVKLASNYKPRLAEQVDPEQKSIQTSSSVLYNINIRPNVSHVKTHQLTFPRHRESIHISLTDHSYRIIAIYRPRSSYLACIHIVVFFFSYVVVQPKKDHFRWFQGPQKDGQRFPDRTFLITQALYSNSTFSRRPFVCCVSSNLFFFFFLLYVISPLLYDDRRYVIISGALL